jgi:tRNA A37 threonylcarbamoyltransferase TsaD
VAVFLPSPSMCTDNGAMIAAAAAFHYGRGERTAPDADIDSSLRLG